LPPPCRTAAEQAGQHAARPRLPYCISPDLLDPARSP
jgi:hypothetical protein